MRNLLHRRLHSSTNCRRKCSVVKVITISDLRQRPSRTLRATDIELVIFVVQWSPPPKLVAAVFATQDRQIDNFSQKVANCPHGGLINNKPIKFINGLIWIASNHISNDAMDMFSE
jgi:hypothetical protein